MNTRTTIGRNRKRGVTVLESLTALSVGLLSGAALLGLVQLTVTTRSATIAVTNADEQARTQLNLLSDKLRNAQSIASGSSYVCFSSAAASDITFYTDSHSNKMRLWMDTTVSPAALKQTVTTAGVATTSTILTGVTGLTFTYYASSGSNYNAPLTGWLTTLLPTLPTLLELPTIGGVRISLTMNINGNSRQLTTLVRFRNSPYSSS